MGAGGQRRKLGTRERRGHRSVREQSIPLPVQGGSLISPPFTHVAVLSHLLQDSFRGFNPLLQVNLN